MDQNKDKEQPPKPSDFEDYDLFEEFTIKKINISNEGNDNDLDFTRWQQDYEDEIDADDFEVSLQSMMKK